MNHIYDYQCQICGARQDDIYASVDERAISCPCGGIANRIPSFNSRPQVFKAGLFEHVAEQPLYCGSKSDLRAVCRENNCSSDYAW